MDNFNLATLIISLIALVLSGYSLWLQNKSDKRENDRINRQERKNLIIHSYVGQSAFWIISGGKVKDFQQLKLEITNDSEREIHIDKIIMEFYTMDLLKEKDSSRKFSKKYCIQPGIKKTISFSLDKKTTFDIDFLKSKRIKFLIFDTVGTMYESKLIRYDNKEL